MSHSTVTHLLHHVRRLAQASVPDDDLLTDYLARRDDSTFSALLSRHGPMVLNLCRRILRDAHAAEDVFQATFLVLAQRAASIQRRESLASWLHGVAFRLAVRARRRRPAGPVSESDVAIASDPAERLAWQEMLGILDEELHQLPDRFRAPLILCYLDGRTQDEAARALGWSLGTLRRRLEHARDLLNVRLQRRGVSLPAALSGLLAAGTVAVPGSLQAATVSAALAVVKQGGGILSSPLVKALVALTLSGGMVIGAGFWISHTQRSPAVPPVAPAARAGEADVAVAKAVEAVEECKEVNWAILKELAVLEARRGAVAAARSRFTQAVNRIPATTGFARAVVHVLLAHGIASAGDIAAATALLEEARRVARTLPRTNDQYEILRFAAVCCGEKVSPTKALAWAREIPDEGFRLNALRDIAAAQARAGDIGGALRTVDLIPQPYAHARLQPWEAIAAAQIAAGDADGARETLDRALAVLDRIRESNRDSALGSEVEFMLRYAVAQARAGNQAAARKTFGRVEQLLAPGARPESLALLSYLARAQAQAGESREAARTVRRCLRFQARYGLDGAPVPLMVTQVLLGDLDGAVKLARNLTQPQERFDVFQAFGESGHQDRGFTSAREAHSPEARAWGMLGVASGVLNRLPPGLRPRYPAGTFTLVLPHAPTIPEAKPVAPSLRTEMEQAIQEWEQEWARFNERLARGTSPAERQKMLENDRPRGENCVRKLLSLADRHRGQPIAFQALLWIVEHAALAPSGREALAILLRDYRTEKAIGEVCTIAGMTLPGDPGTEKLLRTTLQNGPHHAARGEACLALAHLLRDRARQARSVQRRAPTAGDPPDWQRLRTLDLPQLEAEAEKLYERVVADYADIFPSRHTQSLGQSARKALDEIRRLAVGKVAPEIEGKDLNGKPLRLSEHRGKVVVLVFWAKWCGPCRHMISQERALVRRLAGRPFVLLGINGDGDRKSLEKWPEKNPLPWRSWWDGENGAGDGKGWIAQAWNVSSWPTVYVLDGRGVIRYRDVFDRDLDKAIDSLLREAGR